MSEYAFQATDIEFKLLFRMRTAIKAYFGRGATFNIFCKENGIQTPVKSGQKYAVPTKYLMKHDFIEEIGKKRDKIILSIYGQYSKITANLDNRLAKLSEEIDNREKCLKVTKDNLAEIKAELEKTKDSLEIITLQSRIHVIKTDITNQNLQLDEMEAEKKTLVATGVENKKQWKNQVQIVVNITDSLCDKFCTSIGAKIVKHLGFNKFEYLPPAYSDAVEEVIN